MNCIKGKQSLSHVRMRPQTVRVFVTFARSSGTEHYTQIIAGNNHLVLYDAFTVAIAIKQIAPFVKSRLLIAHIG